MGLIRNIEGVFRSLFGSGANAVAKKPAAIRGKHRKEIDDRCLPFLKCGPFKRDGFDTRKQYPWLSPDSASDLHRSKQDVQALRVMASKSASSEDGHYWHGLFQGSIRPKSLVPDDVPVRPPELPARPVTPADSEASLNHFVRPSTQTVDLGSSSLCDRNVGFLYKSNNKIPISPKPASVIMKNRYKSWSNSKGEAQSLTKPNSRITASLIQIQGPQGSTSDDSVKSASLDSRRESLQALEETSKRAFSTDSCKKWEQTALEEHQCSNADLRAQCLAEAHFMCDYGPYRNVMLGKNMHTYNWGRQTSSASAEPKPLHLLVASVEVASTMAKLRCSAGKQPELYKSTDLRQRAHRSALVQQMCGAAYASDSLVGLKKQIGGFCGSQLSRITDEHLANLLLPASRSGRVDYITR